MRPLPVDCSALLHGEPRLTTSSRLRLYLPLTPLAFTSTQSGKLHPCMTRIDRSRLVLWSQSSQVIQSYGSPSAAYGLMFLGAHFVWAFSLMFLFSGRGYWQSVWVSQAHEWFATLSRGSRGAYQGWFARCILMVRVVEAQTTENVSANLSSRLLRPVTVPVCILQQQPLTALLPRAVASCRYLVHVPGRVYYGFQLEWLQLQPIGGGV